MKKETKTVKDLLSEVGQMDLVVLTFAGAFGYFTVMGCDGVRWCYTSIMNYGNADLQYVLYWIGLVISAVVALSCFIFVGMCVWMICNSIKYLLNHKCVEEN